jgi:hypothetical protein
MKILILTVDNATQAKLILKPKLAVLKIPGNLPLDMQRELRTKFMKVADMNGENKDYLKMYYKIGTPYLFLNKKQDSKKKTAIVYKYDEL